MPSVTAVERLLASECIQITPKSASVAFTYAIQRESGDHAYWRISANSFLSTCSVLPVVASAHHSRPVLSENASFFESGDHTRAKRNVAGSFVICFAGNLPSADSTVSWYSPDASDQHAIHLPSGDQTGSRSRALGVFVRLRTSPFSAGTENSSPRASITARLPEGDRSMPVIQSSTLR
jgi:hypothetical protein